MLSSIQNKLCSFIHCFFHQLFKSPIQFPALSSTFLLPHSTPFPLRFQRFNKKQAQVEIDKKEPKQSRKNSPNDFLLAFKNS
jgi:hypothetical protein